ncbi:MAG: EVE domain-containing protein [Myxococcota bacterium]
MARRYWLMKSEPGTYSIQDLAREGTAPWDGVRNYQARNFMKNDMKVGDLMLFYHSSAKPSGVAGVGKVVKKAYPDFTQFIDGHAYFDPTAEEEDPRWWMVDVGFVETFDEVISLAELKAMPSLKKMLVVQKGQRLSVQPVDKQHFREVLRMANAKTRVR